MMILIRTLLIFGWLNCLYFGFYFFKEKQSFDEFLKFHRDFYFDWWMITGFFGTLVVGLLSLLILFIMAFSIMALLTMIKEWITKGEVSIFKNLE